MLEYRVERLEDVHTLAWELQDEYEREWGGASVAVVEGAGLDRARPHRGGQVVLAANRHIRAAGIFPYRAGGEVPQYWWTLALYHFGGGNNTSSQDTQHGHRTPGCQGWAWAGRAAQRYI